MCARGGPFEDPAATIVRAGCADSLRAPASSRQTALPRVRALHELQVARAGLSASASTIADDVEQAGDDRVGLALGVADLLAPGSRCAARGRPAARRCGRPRRRRRAGRRRRRSAPGRRRRPRPSPRGTRAGTAWSTGSRWCRRRRRSGRSTPSRSKKPSCTLARPDRVGQHADLDAALVQRLPQRPHLGVGEGVRLPEGVVGREQVGVVLEARLGEQVGDGRALLVVAAAAPDDVAGAVQPLGRDRRRRGRRRPRPGPAPATRRGSRCRASGSGCRPSRR